MEAGISGDFTSRLASGSAGWSSPRISSSSSGPYSRSSSSPWVSKSCRRSVSRFMSTLWAKRSDCAACFFDGNLMDDEECSRRRSRVRAYSRFCHWSNRRAEAQGLTLEDTSEAYSGSLGSLKARM